MPRPDTMGGWPPERGEQERCGWAGGVVSRYDCTVPDSPDAGERRPFPPVPSWATKPVDAATTDFWRDEKGLSRELWNIWPEIPLPLGVRWVLFLGLIVA